MLRIKVITAPWCNPARYTLNAIAQFRTKTDNEKFQTVYGKGKGFYPRIGITSNAFTRA